MSGSVYMNGLDYLNKNPASQWRGVGVGGWRVGRRVLSPRCLFLSLLSSLCFVLFLSHLLSTTLETSPTTECNCDNSKSRQTDLKLIKHTAISTTGNSKRLRDNHKLCILVPFRDRFEELQIFAPHMSQFLQDQEIDFEILILNQLDLYRFNRASLINTGYYESKRMGCDYFAMHDVDLLPLNPALNYSFPGLKTAYHVASPEYHPRYNYKTFIGGILIVTLDDFRAVKGMSNRYWGWGLEDDEFFLRLRDGEVSVSRPHDLTTDRNNTFLHVHDRRLRKRDTARVGDQRRVSRRRDRVSGLENVKYDILSRVQMTVEPAHQFWVINVRLHCDKELSPWCELPPSGISATLPPLSEENSKSRTERKHQKEM